MRPFRKRAVILIATDKGLCGALNTNLFRVAAQFDPATTVFITAGSWRPSSSPHPPAASGGVCLRGLAAIRRLPIATFARDLFLNGEVDEVKIVATRFVNTLTQNAASMEFLPVGEIKG